MAGRAAMLNLERTEERRELAQFVRDCRTRTKPQDVGLTPGARRRTPGLRREEVAQLAGVSVTWYTWFEQGRDIQVSPGFLERVSTALCLDDAEKTHLIELAQRRPTAPSEPDEPTVAAPQALARRQDDPPPAVNVNRPALVSVRSAEDLEAHRINESIRKVLVAEEGRVGQAVAPAAETTVPPTAADRSGGLLRWGVAMTLLLVLMLVPY
ncbi:MAG: helix-turn-helix domain-containing protein [Alphaproteobacteria bacterium]|nr:helix-turn-helix domain-containing protein [Alphaproteobacteria bacterium]